MKNSAIEWTDHTFNPWIGCTKVSPGCANCYAETLMDTRMGRVRWGKGNPRQRTSAAYWRQPLKWDREAAASGVRPRVFCASLADWLDDEVPLEWLADLLGLIAQTPNLDWLLLTKRPELWRYRISEVAESGFPGNLARGGMYLAADWFEGKRAPENVWIGTSVEDFEAARTRLHRLVRIPAVVRFVSCEPLLGDPLLNAHHVTIPWLVGVPGGRDYTPLMSFIHWVIVGGESGANARPMDRHWARNVRDDCAAAGVLFFFKQWGEFDQNGNRVGKNAAGRLLDGVEHNAFPR